MMINNNTQPHSYASQAQSSFQQQHSYHFQQQNNSNGMKRKFEEEKRVFNNTNTTHTNNNSNSIQYTPSSKHFKPHDTQSNPQSQTSASSESFASSYKPPQRSFNNQYRNNNDNRQPQQPQQQFRFNNNNSSRPNNQDSNKPPIQQQQQQQHQSRNTNGPNFQNTNYQNRQFDSNRSNNQFNRNSSATSKPRFQNSNNNNNYFTSKNRNEPLVDGQNVRRQSFNREQSPRFNQTTQISTTTTQRTAAQPLMSLMESQPIIKNIVNNQAPQPPHLSSLPPRLMDQNISAYNSNNKTNQAPRQQHFLRSESIEQNNKPKFDRIKSNNRFAKKTNFSPNSNNSSARRSFPPKTNTSHQNRPKQSRSNNSGPTQIKPNSAAAAALAIANQSNTHVSQMASVVEAKVEQVKPLMPLAATQSISKQESNVPMIQQATTQHYPPNHVSQTSANDAYSAYWQQAYSQYYQQHYYQSYMNVAQQQPQHPSR